MFMRILSGSSSVRAALASWMLFASSARAQDPQSAQSRLESEVMQMRAENGAIRLDMTLLHDTVPIQVALR